MKKKRLLAKLSLTAFLLSFLALSLADAQAAADTDNPTRITVATLEHAPVFSYVDKQTGIPSGFVIEVMDKIADRGGFSVTYKFKNNWADVLSALQSGEADVALGVAITEDRKGTCAFTRPIDTIPVSLFVRANDNSATGLSSISRVGAMKGSITWEIIKHNYPKVIVEAYESYSDGLFDLLSGHIDAFSSLTPTIMQLSREAGIEDKIKLVGKPLFEVKIALAVQASNANLLSQLDNIIGEFVHTAEYKHLYNKWHFSTGPYWTVKRILITAAVFAVIIIVIMIGWRHYSIVSLNKSLLETKEKLKQSELFSKTIIESEPECVKLLDAEGNLIMMNRAGLDMIEAESLEQVKGQCVCPLIVPEYWDYFMKLTKKVFNGGSGSLTFEMIGLKGRRLCLETHAVPFLNEKGEITALLGITRDITEKKKAEDAIATEKERLAVTLRSIGDAVIVTDTDGVITLMNRVAEGLTGWTTDECLGKPLSEVFNIIDDTTRDRCESPVHKALSTGLVVGLANHTALIRKDGSEIIIADSAAAIRDKESKIIGVVLVFRDITAQYKTEAELQKMQKLESLGLLAGGLAHDFNNLLTGIMGNVGLAKMQFDKGHKAFDYLVKAEAATERAASLTQQLLTFAKGGEPIKRKASIANIVKESVEFALHGSNVRCEYMVPADLWNTEVDVGQMAQVFNNLIINAIHAMPNGGIVHISFDNILLAENQVPTLPCGDYVQIEFRDEGTGIAVEHLSKIFDPYFTTKKQGSGLGLTTIFSIINRHGGYITVKSKIGQGTTFYIYLPATRDLSPDECRKKDYVSLGHGRILVMDDESIVRDTAGEMLTALGYEIEFANDGGKAIELYAKAIREKQPFDAVMMDLTIPGGMSGKDAVKKLLEIDAAAKVIVSSGYSTDPIMSNYKEYGFKGVITKPYNISQVSQTISKVLAS
ncbi:MAG: transporter substrate-binding domain-containing protein [Nitrospirae bacterium]|nr:transporter substrate-binding domain-containing protein [Nitrospirota bacterium]